MERKKNKPRNRGTSKKLLQEISNRSIIEKRKTKLFDHVIRYNNFMRNI